MSLGFYASILPCDTTSYVHSDNIYGGPISLSDARLKTERTDVTGEQALSVLSNIQGCTYNREDLGQRRLGLIADEVETAIAGFAIDNVCSSKHATFNDVEDEYKTLDYSRLVSLLIPAVNSLAARVQELEMTTTKKLKKDGPGSKQPI